MQKKKKELPCNDSRNKPFTSLITSLYFSRRYNLWRSVIEVVILYGYISDETLIIGDLRSPFNVLEVWFPYIALHIVSVL